MKITQWFNPRALLSPSDLQEIYRYENFQENLWLYPQEVIAHWESTTPALSIPEAVQESYHRLGRPTPITRARALEEYLQTDCQIYLKREDFMPNGSFKICSALPQAYYGAKEGRTETITETGAGQTGAAAALASRFFGMNSTIFMVRNSYEIKVLRRRLMEAYGSRVFPSPSEHTQLGMQKLRENNTTGSIAIATSEVFEVLRQRPQGMNIAGSLLDFTLTYNSIIGLECLQQLQALDVQVNTIVGCVGGGSSFGGFAMPFIEKDDTTEIIAVESAAIPTLTQGVYDFDFPDGEGEARPLKMLSLGYKFQPPPLHASGLRYHAASPLVSYFVKQGRIQAMAYDESQAMSMALQMAQCEGILVAPESSYTIKGVMDLASRYNGTGRAILGLITGSGMLDLDAYSRFSSVTDEVVER